MKLRQKVFQSAAFLSYWMQAMNEHSLHSPFIYKLYTEVIKKDLQSPVFYQIEQYRQKYLNNKDTIEISDLGAGSSISGRKKRSIQKIARNSLTTPRFSKLLYGLISQMEAKAILELGTSLGINTLYLSAASPQGTVYSMEGCPATAKMARQLFSNWPQKNICFQEGNIDILLPDLLEKQVKKIDAAYLDANHTYEASINYFKLLLPCLHENSFVVLDDIYWSPGMKKAWDEICKHPAVSLSVDLYDAGLLFFQPQLPKSHYVLEF